MYLLLFVTETLHYFIPTLESNIQAQKVMSIQAISYYSDLCLQRKTVQKCLITFMTPFMYCTLLSMTQGKGGLICMVKQSQMRHLMQTCDLVTLSCVHLSTRSQAVTFSYYGSNGAQQRPLCCHNVLLILLLPYYITKHYCTLLSMTQGNRELIHMVKMDMSLMEHLM